MRGPAGARAGGQPDRGGGLSDSAQRLPDLPWRGLHFSLTGSLLYETLYGCEEDEEEVHRRAAYWLEELWRANELVITRLYPLFTGSAAALAFELMFWALALKDII